MLDKKIAYPFNVVTGEGLGLSYSSMTQVGALLDSKPLGQANIDVSFNAATGNLVVKDTQVRCMEPDFKVDFQWTYNSLAASTHWHLSLSRITQFNEKSGTITLAEADGHLTTYAQPVDNHMIYYAPYHGDGRAFFVKKDNGTWLWRSPKTQYLKVYDGKTGLLVEQISPRGRTLKYAYEGSQLTSITGESGTVYELRRTKSSDTQVVDLYVGSNLLWMWVFDAKGRLTQSASPAGTNYKTDYSYYDAGFLLNKILQTDQSQMTFGYQVKDSKVKSISFAGGEQASAIYRPSYAEQSTTLQMTTGLAQKVAVAFNDKLQITSFTRTTGTAAHAPYQSVVTECHYTPNGQVLDITHPNGGIETFVYLDHIGLISEHTDVEQEKTTYTYWLDGAAQRLISISKNLSVDTPKAEPAKIATSRYVFDVTQTTKFLRFELSPRGKVTEYRYDAKGNLATKRMYLDKLFDVGSMPPASVPSLSAMLSWVKTQDPAHVFLQKFTYDDFGNLRFKYTFVNVNDKGEGIEDDLMGWESFNYTRSGEITLNQARQAQMKFIYEQWTFDALDRPMSHSNALMETSIYSYGTNDAPELPYKRTLKAPNGRETTDFYNHFGDIDQKIVTAGKVSRTWTQTRNIFQSPTKVVQPDGQIIFQFYDYANELAFSVSPLGYVTFTDTQTALRYQSVIRYANPIDPSKLNNKWGALPTFSKFLELFDPVKDSPHNRETFQCFDKGGRLRYAVDEDNYVVETRWSLFGKVVGTIQYAAPLTGSEISTLKTGNPLTRKINPATDRCERFFYNEENQLKAEQDAGGFVTYYLRDTAGWVIDKVQYFNKSDIDFSAPLTKVIPPIDLKKDAHTFYAYDKRGQKIAKLNAEGYFSAYTYTPNSKRLTKTTYANKPAGTFPSKPEPSENDEVTSYHYDMAGQISAIDHPWGLEALRTHDNMGHLTQTQKQLKGTDKTDGDFARLSARRYDGFEQVTNLANPLVGQLLLKAANQSEKDDIWNTKSLRTIYSDCGLKIQTIDPLGNNTFYYYDKDRRLSISVNPRGQVLQYTLNPFGDESQVRRYANLLDIEGLTGGFLTAEFLKTLAQLKDDEKDEIEIFSYSKRGLWTQKTDPEKYPWAKQYSAFRQCILEQNPLDSKAVDALADEIQHTFDTRGNPATITRTNTKTGLSLTTTLVHSDNPKGKLTKVIAPDLSTTTHSYDRLGLLVQTTDALSVVSLTQTFDAFKRLATQTNALGEEIAWTYSQATRTRIKTFALDSTTVKQTLNAFFEVISSMNALSQMEVWLHTPEGKVLSFTNALGHTRTQTPDLLGIVATKTNLASVETTFTYYPDHTLKISVFDPKGLTFTTHYTRNGFGDTTELTDHREIKTVQTFSKRGERTTGLLQPSGLQRLTSQSYNGQRRQITHDVGTQSAPAAIKATQVTTDGINRVDVIEIDPLVDSPVTPVTSDLTLSLMGQVKIEKLPKTSQQQFHFYDPLQRERFRVSPYGDVHENIYDEAGRLTATRAYLKPVDVAALSASTTLKDFEAMVEAQVADPMIFIFYDHNGNARFHVSHEGHVRETRYDVANRPILNVGYVTQNTDNPSTLSLSALEDWVKSHANATDTEDYYVLDALGQVRFQLDAKGYVTEKTYDAQGRVLTQTAYAKPVADPAKVAQLPVSEVANAIPLDPDFDQTTKTTYDTAGRILTQTDAKLQTTTYTYDDSALTTTIAHPDGRMEVKTYDAEDKPVSNANSAEIDGKTQTRTTTTVYSPDNRTLKITHPGNKVTCQIKDALFEPLYEISATGAVSLSEKTTATGVTKFTEYATPIDLSSLPEFPTAAQLAQLVKPSADDRTRYHQKNVAENIEYELDAKNFLVEKRFDANGRLTHVIHYANPLSASQSADLIAGKALNLPFSPETDRLKRHFYNAENEVIAKQDAGGYVTLFERDGLNQVTKTTRFATPTTVSMSATLASITPIPVPGEDAIEYHRYNARGQKILTVDAQGYATTFAYTATHKVQTKTRYATKVPASWLKNPVGLPDLTPTSEDKTRYFFYDKLNRLTRKVTSDAKIRTLSYDVQGNIIQDETIDNKAPGKSEGDVARRTASVYNAFGDETNTANAYVGQLLLEIDNDPNLNPTQKAEAKAKVWSEQSFRCSIDGSGLKCSEVSPLGHKTFFFYDDNRRLVATIDPTGFITETTRNGFGEVTISRAYATRLTTSQLETLTGGFATAAFYEMLQKQENDADRLTRYTHDTRGQLETKTDPMEQVVTTTYDGFGQIQSVMEPVASNQDTMITTYEREPRGYVIHEIKSAGDLSVTTSYEYKNLYGHKTATTDALKHTTRKTYTQRGELASDIDASHVTILKKTYDAFGRTDTKTDANGNVTHYTYNQSTRTMITTTPVEGVTRETTQNIFGETIAQKNAKDEVTNTSHDPAGAVKTITDPLGQTQTTTRDLMGRTANIQQKAGQIETITRNGAGQVTQSIADSESLKSTTTFTPSAFGEAILVVSPKGIQTTHEYNKLGHKTLSCVDAKADGLQLTHATAYNAQSQPILETDSNVAKTDSFVVETTMDPLNRITGQVEDPAGLKLTTKLGLNALSQVTSKTDTAARVAYTYYDVNGRKRFHFDADGCGTQWQYNKK